MIRKKRTADVRFSYTVRIETGIIIALLIAIGVMNVQLPASEARQIIYSDNEELTFVLPPVTNHSPDEVLPVSEIPTENPDNSPAPDEPDFLPADVSLSKPVPVFISDKKVYITENELTSISTDRTPRMIGGEADFKNRIDYPNEARRNGIQGIVEIEFTVTKKGQVRDAVVIRGIGGGCDEAVLKAIKRQKYNPGIKAGQLSSYRLRETVQFVLLNQTS